MTGASGSETARAPATPESTGIGAHAARGVLERARRGVWRVAVSEDSMTPAIEPGDWLLVDPTGRRWPRRGSVVVFREPETDLLAIKRVFARSGHVHVEQGILELAPGEAWLVGDHAGHSRDFAGVWAGDVRSVRGPSLVSLWTGSAAGVAAGVMR